MNSDYFEEVYTGYGGSKWTNSTIAAFFSFFKEICFKGLCKDTRWVCPAEFGLAPAELKDADVFSHVPLFRCVLLMMMIKVAV